MLVKFTPVSESLPQPFVRVYVQTDKGATSNGYVRTDGKWTINCPLLVNAGHKVIGWKK